MISRGEVGLIVASVGIHQGLIVADLFSVVVAMVLVTTLVTPPLLRILFGSEKPNAPRPPSKTEQTDPITREAT